MELLGDADIRLMLRFLHEASEVDGPDAFTEPVVDALVQLIPSDGGVACNMLTGAKPGVAPEARSVLSFAEISCDWCADIQTQWTDELDEVCRAYVECHDPIPPVPRFVSRAVRQSDVLSVRDQRRNELCGYLARATGVEDVLCLWLASAGEGALRRIQFAFGKRGGSSDRDVRVLELLAPHLTRLYERAAARRAASHVLGDLTPREHEVIRLIAGGKTNREIARVLWISPNTVRTHLENIFEKLGVSNRTAAAALALGATRHPDGGRARR